MQAFNPPARAELAQLLGSESEDTFESKFEVFEREAPSGPRLTESAIERNAMVVAMERGTKWPSWIESFRRRAPNVVVIVQQPGENLDAFADRIEQRKPIMRGEPFVVMTAVLLAAVNGGRLRGRLQLASSLISMIDFAGLAFQERRFVIGTSDAQRPRSAYALLRLAERLSILSHDTGLTISTRLWSESLKKPGVVCR